MFASSLLSITALAATLISAQDVPAFEFGSRNADAAGVRATGNNGPTNPDSPSLDTPINQTSLSRLASVNSIDDWCTFGPHISGQPIGNIEPDVVAWCTKPRNNARVIPDGTLTAVHFVQTPLYVQVMALGDFRNIMVMDGDEGGELDPHGPNGAGNPVGGNVTSNVSGEDVFYEEWMNFLSYNQVCIRICTAAGSVDEARTERVCEHEYDVMGCQWVMPGDYTDNAFDSCEADVAYPPGLYPQGDGSTSRFQQYFSSVYTDTENGALYTFVNGTPDQATPPAAYSRPASSNCETASSPANGIASLAAAAAPASSASMSSAGSPSGSSSGGTMPSPTSAGNPSNNNPSNSNNNNNNNQNSNNSANDDSSDSIRSISFSASILALGSVLVGAAAIF